MRIAAILVAAGSGVRAGAGLAKQFRPLLGKPVLAWSLDALAATTRPRPPVIVAAPEALAHVRSLAPGAQIVAGGLTRTDSVRAGLAALNADKPDIVLIHDAARPGLDPAVIERLLQALADADGAAPAAPGADAVRLIDPGGQVVDCPPRERFVRVQTPQAFRFDRIRAAYAAWPSAQTATDDIEVALAFGMDVRIVPGSARLHKITYPEDFAMVEALMLPAGGLVARVGTGFDAHRFGPGDHVTLCGVRIAHSAGVVGHSDADVAWHALTDALLGAVGAGDIGDHFPPSDPQWRGACSEIFLRHAGDLVRARGARIVNVDVTIICERPRIKPLRDAMRESTARVLALPVGSVNIKATTTEEMGFTGRGEGIAAQACASVLAPTPMGE